MEAMLPTPNNWDENSDKDIESVSPFTGLLNETKTKIASSPVTKTSTFFRKYADARLLFEGFLVFCLVVALISNAGSSHKTDIVDKRSFGPTLPRKPVIFGNTAGLGPDLVYHDTEMMWNKTRMQEIHRNWHSLFPQKSWSYMCSFILKAGRGYITVSAEEEEFEVLHPAFKMDNVFEQGDHYEGHIMAVYHQLHCLSILMTALGTSREEWAMLETQKVEHRAHCVEYLRQSILCSADTTLEGETGAWAKSTGWGQTHSCVDFDALTEYANKRAMWNLTERLLPDSFDPLKVPEHGEGLEDEH
ncbi:hypothetical protein M747DRAFT_245711 [Aspergillus niger ATCC 13496]|uniref:Contig An06c0090, genomic contig n=3 Tax=Aspergillus niger TaxID=5061 RepID=A2QLR0_ASPNC|nr:uncharacterized protein An06g02120 [Aspergillus niger]RDH16202.1 hypothetical protein M747DRAFT_245711 [Aspergillus niger ATCC 13496]CAK48055.1 unnamed protein product [Aspergillus niger]